MRGSKTPGQTPVESARIVQERERSLAALREHVDALEIAHPELKKDKSFVIAAIQINPFAFQYADAELKKDKGFVLAAICQSFHVLQFADIELKKDKEFVLDAIEINSFAFQYADVELKKDEEFVLAAIEIDSLAFQYADAELKKDKEFVLAAIEINYIAFQYTDAELKKDKEFVLAAVCQNHHVLQFAAPELNTDEEFVLAAIEINSFAFQYADAELKKDKEFVLAAVRQNYRVLQLADPEMNEDKNFVLAAIEINSFAFQYADAVLKRDKELALTAVRQKYRALQFVDPEMKKDKEVVLATIEINSFALQYADAVLNKDKEVVLAAVRQNYRALQFADPEMKKDKEFVLAAIEINAFAFRYADTVLKKDKDLVLAAIRQNYRALQFADPEMKKDKEVILAAVSQDDLALNYADAKLRKNKEVLAAVREDDPKEKLVFEDSQHADAQDANEANQPEEGKALSASKTFEILRKKFSIGPVKELEVDHVAIVCANSETELPPQIRSELALYSTTSTVFAPSVGDLYSACEGKQLAFVVGGFDNDIPTIRRVHGLGYSSAEIVQGILGESPPDHGTKCIVLNFDLSAESLDHSKLDGRVDVVAWRGNVLDVTKFTVFTEQFAQTCEKYPDGDGGLTRVEHAYVTAVTELPWPSNSVKCPVVLLPERESVTKRFKRLKPRKLAIPILSLNADSLDILEDIIPETSIRVQFTITFDGNAQELQNLIRFCQKESKEVSLGGATLGSVVLILISKSDFYKRMRSLSLLNCVVTTAPLDEIKDELQLTMGKKSNYGLLCVRSEFLMVESDAIDALSMDEKARKEAEDICSKCMELWPLKSVFSKQNSRKCVEGINGVFSLKPHIPRGIPRQECTLTIVNKTNVVIYVEIEYGEVSSSTIVGGSISAGHENAMQANANGERVRGAKTVELMATEVIDPNMHDNFHHFGITSSVRIYRQISEYTYGKVFHRGIAVVKHQVVIIDETTRKKNIREIISFPQLPDNHTHSQGRTDTSQDGTWFPYMATWLSMGPHFI